MRLRMMQVVFVLAVVSPLLSSGAWAQSGVTTQTGMLPDGATYLIEVPTNWNGILFLYSHGYVVPGSPNPPQDVAITDPAEQAGLSLDSDLDALEDAARVSPDRHAIEYLEKNIVYNGDIHIPVLTLHTTGDGLVVVQNESAYSQVVNQDDNGELLRRTFVSRAGHCAFTPAETIAAVQTLLERLETGKWPDVEASNMNTAAAGLGPNFNVFPDPTTGKLVFTPSAFVDFTPGPYLRPFGGEAEDCEFESPCHER